MELNQLYCFIQVAKTEHMTQASEQLHITQPALSKNIARLEEDLGVRLFDRQGKSIQLNEYGRVALRYAEQILFSIDDMRTELTEMAEGKAGHIRIGSAFPSHEPNFLLAAIQNFALERPDVRFSLLQLSSRNLVPALENREIDIAVTSGPIRKSGIHWEKLFTEKMGIILSDSVPLARKEQVSILDLQYERFYCNNTNSDVYDLTERFCHQAGFRPVIQFEGEFPTFIGKAVSLGYGVSIISGAGYERSTRRGMGMSWEEHITFRPFAEDWCQRTCGLAILDSRSPTSSVREFYSYLQRHAQAQQEQA